MCKRRNFLFRAIIVVFIFAVIFLSAILNSFSFKGNTVSAVAENTASVLSLVMERSEYGLKYGRELENYYGIDAVFDDIKKYCDSETEFITDKNGDYLYGDDVPEDIKERIEELEESDDNTLIYESDGKQCILHSISGKETTVGYVGIAYPMDQPESLSDPYILKILTTALIASILAALIFEILFRFSKQIFRGRVKVDNKRTRMFVVLSLAFGSLLMIVSTYILLKDGYTYLAEDACSRVIEQNRESLNSLIKEGVRYSDIADADAFFDRISGRSRQIESIRLSKTPDETALSCVMLDADDTGESYYLISKVSKSYISSKIRSALLSVLVSMITALMISSEIIGFLVEIFYEEKKDRRVRVDNVDHKTIESYWVVRGISCFFSSFRYLSVAFMAIVLSEIYEPVVIFGYTIPKEILMSIPMSAQVFISMITSYISGYVINKRGWKSVTITGIAVMILGTVVSALSTSPVPFIIAQMIMGIGLGFAKMGIDIYSFVVASEDDMIKYTSGSNAAFVVGYSCAASVGALVESVFGYSVAYRLMSITGVVTILLILYFGMDVAPRSEVEDSASETVSEWNHKGPDIRFAIYILCVIVPYYFIVMFVDYFFPVYSNSVGITTDIIGLVMMVNGIGSAYLGAYLCRKLSKKFEPSRLMPALLLFLACGILVFSLKNTVIFSILVVLLIGTADGIMPSLQFDYVYKLPFAKNKGFSNALGIEGFFSSFIGAVAPVIFGLVMMYGSGGLAIVSIAVIALTAVFILINRNGHMAKGEKC